jgi:hypothetical protein
MTLNSEEKLSNKPEQDQLPIIIISIVIIIYIILLLFLIKYFLNKSLAKEKHYNEYFKKLKKIKKKEKTLKYSFPFQTINNQHSNESANVIQIRNEKQSNKKIGINGKKKKSNQDPSVQDNKKILYSIV